ncbi:bifunctional diguanylate cyclase/phosphodiesterase [Cryobacterium sp. TMT1-21]|uniref:Bifunctional diguanylate cyclase/phosphodiesterase n=1 Tax=Cryobacterium shii TaxID=1259235 RepID=A0AAQ2C5C9_9MICO|nr:MULTISPECIES: bifunctional diguanylate cyclase/phosphodiesterase [Cryobacterium]TFC44365.1 bifunctional diguanylate cyclase/phosphodiesterase [Cryobacterium shii]TFC88435.1 bifunctional diguanylate cyclase/phosphodiesterase [Cryobacterium sp. TmT2-59]TFD17915.1 bifunctional diguanylate cyclase/phosphodiesterase [Cryobacterium sp. TMT1-21]TFD18910.1 bifunctional diguanylate cyclase/phosphodiesterase [Cryobacterium sp. TMT2-23]TFD20942.1 bifunctional diguanylate cyclase/phosphodiesterase [Cry
MSTILDAVLDPAGRVDRVVCLADLATSVEQVSATTPMTEIDRVFRADQQLRSLVVQEGGAYFLLTREQVEFTLTGRLGYGRGLHARSTAIQMVSENSFALPGRMILANAAQRILELPEGNRYRDVLVLTDDGPRVVSVSQIFERLSADFRYASLHDSLTGLPNRRHLEESGAAAIGGTGDMARVAVLYIDLDGFKAINDTFGHQAGDEILIGFAERLRHIVRPTDVLARQGGDEFAVLLIDVDEGELLAIADLVVLGASVPFVCDGHLLHVTASVGVAMAGDVAAERELTQLDALLRHADGAMLKAKQSGKRQVARLDGHGEAAPIVRNALIRRRLPEAFETRAFSLRYQPQMDLASGDCSAVEALLRWTDPVLGAVSPAEFIPIMELSGDIHRIGERVINEVCAQARRWLDSGTPRRIAVNVSPLQLAARTIVPELVEALHRHGVPAYLIQVEITEGAAITDLPRAVGQLQQLRDAGISIALDDYGTGFSSLSLLRSLPLTTVKIDKTFIDNIDSAPSDALLVGGIIDTAHALGLKVTAEGVERESQRRLLRDLGCDTVQGYLISRPVAPKDLS